LLQIIALHISTRTKFYSATISMDFFTHFHTG